MMQPFGPNDSALIEKRFHDFHDAVIPEIRIEAGESGTTIYIVLEAIDGTERKEWPYDWVRVEFQLKMVSEFCIRQGRNAFPSTIVFAGAVRVFDGRFFVGLDHVDNTSQVDDFRKSDFYVACESVDWSVEPLQGSAWSASSI